MTHRRASALLLLAAAVLSVGSCSREDAVWTDESGLLRYVPADTPYLIGALSPASDEFFDKMEPWLVTFLESYRTIIDAALAEAAAGESAELSDEERRQMGAVRELVAELLTVEGWRNAGVTRDSVGIVYGRGLLPVLRVTLSDGARFEALIERVEAAANSSLPVATLGEQTYRYFENDEIRIVIAVRDDELILTGMPTGLSNEHLTAVLQGELPDESIAASGKLEDFAADYGLRPFQIGFLDFDRFAATFLDPQSGANAELLSLVGYNAEAMLSQTCRTEFRELANAAPRIVFGTTRLDVEEIATTAVLELRSDIATGLGTIAASVPGLGTIGGTFFSFGLGFDVAAARDFAAARLDAIEADPFQCELLQDLQAGVADMRQALNAPLPPLVYDIKGFVAVLDDIRGMNLAAGVPPTSVDLRMLVASDDAPGIVAMASAFDPTIASLELEPNGTPVRVDVPLQIAPLVSEAHAALTQQALAVAVGTDSEPRLRELLDAPAGEPLFASFDMDLRRYYAFLADMVPFAAADDEELTTEVGTAMTDLMTSLAEGPFDRSRGDVRFTDRGVEMLSTVTLN